MLGYLYVRTPGDDGQVDREDDDEDQYAGKQEQPVLTTKLHACNEDDVFIMAIIDQQFDQHQYNQKHSQLEDQDQYNNNSYMTSMNQ